MEEEIINEEIIFQVKINREDEDFELVSRELSNFEFTSLLSFLESYIKANKNIDVKHRDSEYCSNEEDEED